MKQLSIYDNDFIDNFEDCSQMHDSKKSQSSAQKVKNTKNNTPSKITNVYSEQAKNAQVSEFPANVTEIVLTKDKIDSIQLVLPMLINLHQEERWLAWIDPPIQLLKEWQKTHNNAALNDIMILRSNDNLSVFELSKRALTAGTCHAVIAWTNSLNQDEFSKLEEASSKGNSHGIILKSRLNSLQSL